ncbi:hypothetical protein AgCh_027105 [Apium graveolens]
MVTFNNQLDVQITHQLSNYYHYQYEPSVLLSVKGLEVEVKRILFIYTSIDLSSNNFTGEIPEVIGELISLRLLNLSHNSLTGHMPSLLGNMSLLESLDFSSNQLTGIIPRKLTSLTFLSTLNLSENHLSGAIPQGRQFDTFSNETFIGYLALEVDDNDEDGDEDNWFEWKMMLMVYGYGLVGGLSTGYIVLTTLKPIKFVIFVERAQQKLIRRCKKSKI